MFWKLFQHCTKRMYSDTVSKVLPVEEMQRVPLISASVAALQKSHAQDW